tara:strand:+ start:1272 stop:1964 length:693 start_codon:yes stop_codon:yes gene_type:complete
MTTITNYLLVGNSRLHWAEKGDNKIRFSHSSVSQGFPKYKNTNNLIWASVGNHSKMFLNKSNEIKTTDLTMQKIPKHFGVDRALACFAAFKMIKNQCKKNIVIADLGTTLSITKISSNGDVIGGQLVPGFLTQLKSLEQNTKHLQLPPTFDIPKVNFLLSTEKAMLRGVYNSLLGAINLSFNENKDLLIICGGDAELIGKELQNTYNKNIKIKPNLVLTGMILFHELIHK